MVVKVHTPMTNASDFQPIKKNSSQSVVLKYVRRRRCFRLTAHKIQINQPVCGAQVHTPMTNASDLQPIKRKLTSQSVEWSSTYDDDERLRLPAHKKLNQPAGLWWSSTYDDDDASDLQPIKFKLTSQSVVLKYIRR